MKKMMRTFALAVGVVGALVTASPAAACPPCSKPWLWDQVCLAQWCQICGCNDRSAQPFVDVLASSDETATDATLACATAEEVSADPSAPAAAPSAVTEARD